ncbi:MAG: hypothetical protein AAF514_01315 [Verrucomicrobiota bacterium]
MSFLSRFSPSVRLPLYVKELTEIANRDRTYVIRFFYAFLLFASVVFLTRRALKSNGIESYGLDILGQGMPLWDSLVLTQTIGILFFVPLLMAGLITMGKERDSLSLLFLTELSPGAILWQKYLAGLVPMFTMILLCPPVASVAYSLGGLEWKDLVSGILALLQTCLLTGAVAILASSFSRGTATALLVSYLLVFLLYAGLSLPHKLQLLPAALEEHRFFLFPYLHWKDLGGADYLNAYFYHGLQFGLVAILLAFARWFLPRRAFASGDARFRRWKEKRAERRRLKGHQRASWWALPNQRPIAWREFQTASLRYLRFLIPAAILLLAVTARALAINDRLSVAFALWIPALILPALQGVHAIGAERRSQALEVLLTTPLSAAGILKEKARGAWANFLFLGLVVLGVSLIEFLARSGDQNRVDRYWSGYPVVTILTLLVYLPLSYWWGLWCGMRIRSRYRALTLCLLGMVALAGLPLLAIDLATTDPNPPGFRHTSLLLSSYYPENPGFKLMLSPASIILMNEQDFLRSLFGGRHHWSFVLGNTAVYFLVFLLIRWRCLRSAERFLYRS